MATLCPRPGFKVTFCGSEGSVLTPCRERTFKDFHHSSVCDTYVPYKEVIPPSKGGYSLEATRSGGFNFNLADLSRKYTFKRDTGWLQECQGEQETSLEVRLPRTMLQFKPLVSVSKQHCPALDTTALDCDHQNIHHLPLPLSPGTVLCSPHWFASLWPISFYNIPQGTEALWGFFKFLFLTQDINLKH